MNHLSYKGYTGSIEYSDHDKILFGKVMGIQSLISYEGATGVELDQDFKDAIDDYLDDCKEDGTEPEKPFKGSFNVRIPSELHRTAAIKAIERNTSLNGLVTEAIRDHLHRPSTH